MNKSMAVWHEGRRFCNYVEVCNLIGHHDVVWVFELDEVGNVQPFWLSVGSGEIFPAKEIWDPPDHVRKMNSEADYIEMFLSASEKK